MLVSGAGSLTPSTGGYEIDNSLRFNDDDSANLSRTPSVAGNRKTWTFSTWFKKSNTTSGYFWSAAGDATNSSAYIYITADVFRVERYDGDGTYTFRAEISGSRKFRDPSAWYHLTVAFDSTDSTSSNRLKVYINGELQTLSFITGSIALNSETDINDTNTNRIGGYWSNGSTAWDGYLAEVNFVDGQALSPSDFGETGDYGEWKPIAYAGTYGTNGFYLDFKNSGSLGNDANGSNNWTPNNLASTDVMLDTPSNNFAHWNPLYYRRASMQEGNLAFRGTTVGGSYGGAGTFLMESGKWYWEFVPTSSFNTIYSGIANSHNRPNSHFHTSANGYWFESSGAAQRKITSGTSTTISGSNNVAGDVMQIAFDVDAGKIWFGKNNTWSDSGNPASGANAQYTSISNSEGFVPSYGDWGNTGYTYFNFGSDATFSGEKSPSTTYDDGEFGSFFYQPPNGFLALCTKNLPTPAVIPSENFNVVAYAGNETDGRSISVGFAPDLIWSKSRNISYTGSIYDKVRGAGASKHLATSETAVEGGGNSVYGHISSFDSDGYSLGVGSDGSQPYANENESSINYVSWNWKAGGTTLGTGDFTQGTISSTASVNADAGFSIVSFSGNSTSGSTVGHGLSKKPEMVMIKSRDSTYGWGVGLFQFHNNEAYFLNNVGQGDIDNYWGNTNPTDSLFTLGSKAVTNNSGDAMIAYCFHSVEGFSKMGTYGGTGATNGADEEQPCIFTGFRPAYVMIKVITATDSWMVFDTKRDPYNLVDTAIFADSAAAESSSGAKCIDILSNGFKLRGTDTAVNGTAHTYFYLAFAEVPFKFSNAR